MPYELLRWYWKALRQALRRGWVKCISSTLISIRGPYWRCDLTRLHLPLARLDSQVTSAPDSFRSCCAQSTAGRLCGVKVAGFRDPFKISHVLGCKWDMDRLLGRLEATACPGSRRALGATPRHWPLVAGLCHQLQWSASNCLQKNFRCTLVSASLHSQHMRYLGLDTQLCSGDLLVEAPVLDWQIF